MLSSIIAVHLIHLRIFIELIESFYRSDVYNLTIPSIHPSYDQGRWRFIYSTANNNYDVDTVSIGSDLTYNECNDNV